MPRFGSAILLAGGRSRRMGFDKQTIRTKGGPLPHALIRQLLNQFQDIIVATNDAAFYAGLPVRTVADRFPGLGPMAGIEAGLRAARSDFVFVLACDMPVYDADFSELLRQKLDENVTDEPAADLPEGIVTCLDDGRIEPFNAFYHKSLADRMARSLQKGQRSLTRFLLDQNLICLTESEARVISPDLAVFRNLNDRDDLSGFDGIRSPEVTRTALSPDEQKLVCPVNVVRVSGDRQETLTDAAIAESIAAIRVLEPDAAGNAYDDRTCRFRQSFSVLADRLDDFAVGYLLSGGFIDSGSDLDEIRIREVSASAPDDAAGAPMWQIDVCVKPGAWQDNPQIRKTGQSAVTPDLPFPTGTLFSLFDDLDRGGSLFHLTGGTHVLAFADRDGRLIDLVQDVSRHAALDKLIGKAAREGRPFSDLVLLASCRLTFSIVAKAITAGIGLLASRAAVTTLAVSYARAHHVRLIGFVRNGRLNIYP